MTNSDRRRRWRHRPHTATQSKERDIEKEHTQPYDRVSRESQSESMILETRMAVIERFCKEGGIEIVDRYINQE